MPKPSIRELVEAVQDSCVKEQEPGLEVPAEEPTEQDPKVAQAAEIINTFTYWELIALKEMLEFTVSVKLARIFIHGPEPEEFKR